MKKPKIDVRALAKEIASELFTPGPFNSGRPRLRATRLVLMFEPKHGPHRDLGGWCEAAVVDLLEKMLASVGKR